MTQLFTEDYMVRFLLENSLGAWWAFRRPDSPLVKTFSYLRFLDDGTPAAGAFPGWPDRAALITAMDPCGGSGHFVVAEFDMLRRMRMEEEGLSAAEAGDAVIRDNLFMLEIDPRCTQIATFALAMAAWKSGGYRSLPIPNIACSGIAVEGQLDDWLKLADGDSRLRTSLERLYNLFREAPTLGSLIDPAHVPVGERMWSAEYEQVGPFLERALARERGDADPVARLVGAGVQGVMRAVRLLAGNYTLVATNVPYLGRGDHEEDLKSFADSYCPEASADLATVFLIRCQAFLKTEGTCALVTPQNWLFLVSYQELRRKMLSSKTWNFLCWIGEKGFESSAAAGAFTILLIHSDIRPGVDHIFAGIDAALPKNPSEKAAILRGAAPVEVPQLDQLSHPGARVSFVRLEAGALLRKWATSYQGIKTGDDGRMRRCFWEIPAVSDRWRFYQSTVTETKPYGGLESIIDWSNIGKDMARLQGLGAWGKPGVAVSLMRELRCALYTGCPFDSNMSALVVGNPEDLPAVWAFASSGNLSAAVRATFKKTNASDASITEVPFDLAHWRNVARSLPALPTAHSCDPTQWLFEGQPAGATNPLQVAVARLLGYHCPQQKTDTLDAYADPDGIVCLPPVAGEQDAAESLRAQLAAAYGDEWSLSVQHQLLAGVGFKDRDLADWLRDGFFEQHCRLFHNRPFIWHIWDGRRDGFSALVNYHKLNAANLDKLIYTYLGNWIETQRAERELGVAGADGRLVAALQLKKKLELIRDGEPPHDIYVRWKPPAEQPIGWNPDLNDGVRLNIRPFVTAGALRSKFTINWNKDRGKNPDGSERLNDLHLTRAEKLAARAFSRG